MKKLLIILFVTQLLATNARINSLGSISYFIIDDANVHIFPHLISDYPNKIISEFRDTIFNCYVKFGNTSIGVEINSDTVPSIINTIFNNAPFIKSKPKKQIAGYISRKLDFISLGIKLGETSEYYENKEANCLQSFNINKFVFGIKYKGHKLIPTITDIALGVYKIKFENRTANILFRDRDELSFDGKIRLLLDISTSFGAILGGGFESIRTGFQEYAESKRLGSISFYNYNGYIGFNLLLGENTKMFLGNLIEMSIEDSEGEKFIVKNITKSMPKFIIGSEIKINNWLNGRISGNKTFIENKRIYENEVEEINKTTKFELGIGFGFSFNKILIDISSINFNKYFVATTYNF